jgi:nicotinamidase/pyrazinamidase
MVSEESTMKHANVSTSPGRGDALVVVDMQNDFLPGGRFAVPDGGAVVMPLNRAIKIFHARGLPIFATRDWHPPEHCSFIERGGHWPRHCVAGTAGAAFAPDLLLPDATVVISRATLPEREAYSGFQGTDLDARLRASSIVRLYVGGLAAEYCVLNTVLDARVADYKVILLVDAIRPVEVNPGDGERALARMRGAGAILLETAELAA